LPGSPAARQPGSASVAVHRRNNLRVENLNADADVAGTQTSLIFEHLRGASPL